MAPDVWDVAGLGQMLNLAAGRVSDRKLDLFNGWACHALRPYLTDPRSRAAARYAEAHINQRSPDTVGLARAAYEDRAFARLPLLADALMDAGCDDDRLLDHCRSRGPHVRGCWAVDLVLGKE